MAGTSLLKKGPRRTLRFHAGARPLKRAREEHVAGKRPLSGVFGAPHGKTSNKQPPVPLWVVSYADMVTLLLCFMVLLAGISVIDARTQRAALGSVNRQYEAPLLTSLPESPEALEFGRAEGSGGPMTGTAKRSSIKDQLLQQNDGDIVLQENKFVEVASINEKALFENGTAELSPEGKHILDRLLPALVDMDYTLLIAGYTAPRRDEEGLRYIATLLDNSVDSTWLLSLDRSLAVYDYLAEKGVAKASMRVEGAGQYRPLYTTATPEGRRKNKRVDLVLDKRNIRQRALLGRTVKEGESSPNDAYFKGFKFDLTMPEPE